MQDAGGDAIEDHTQDADRSRHELSKPQQTEAANDRDHVHLDPSRYWLAGSAFPLIAGTLGPVASAFSICALVRPWRQHMPPGMNIEAAPYIPDPKWLLIINAVQLALALVANVFLLLNMTKRVRFTIAQPITIIGWYISSVCLIALNATAAGPLDMHPQIDYVWSQAFYYGAYAAGLYFICSSLMVVTFMGAYLGRYGKDFQLTTSQRTLMLQTILFLMYLLIGALVFSNIEGWSYLDAVYWADVTLFTVGFGDYYANTTLGRALLFPYALVGIISLGLVIGSIRSLVLDRGRNKLGARMLEKKRRTILRRMTQRGKDGILSPITDDEMLSPTGTGLTEFERREAEFKLMRKIQRQAARRRRWMAMGVSSSTWLTLWLAGAAIFQSCEKPYQYWTYFDGMYFCFVSLTTVGYGDMVPISPAGKSFFVLWSLLALPTTTVLISNAGDTIVKGIRDATNSLGTITILPGERGFKKDFKDVLRVMSGGALFTEDIEESPPGFLGEAAPQRTDSSSESDEEDVEDESKVKMPQKGQEKSTGTLDEEVRGITGKAEAGSHEVLADDSNESVANGNSKGGRSTDISPDSTAQGSSSSTASPPDRIRILEPARPVRTSDSPASPNSPTHHHYHGSRPSSSRSNTSIDNVTANTLRMRRAVSMPRQDLPQAVPTDPADYHVVLVDEIARVTQHLKSHPPRKYTFQEWVWYLRLIGEDESNAETHRRARPHVHRRHQRKNHSREDGGEEDKTDDDSGSTTGTSSSIDEGGRKQGRESKAREEKQHEGEDAEAADKAKLQWSWVGRRSPLMSSQEEAEWILEKLTQKLAEELRRARSQEHHREREKRREKAEVEEGRSAS
ncbi:Potassium channel protein [Pleurostoma richardsiae]|uniref:Potassium channel protein n=1 Tax=Pleurostoma richardsiae TaxID=41990 RepID=A0AA38VM73_9PEZI|nr:Potassium channel protein [Pleurostoma richardsiae]